MGVEDAVLGAEGDKKGKANLGRATRAVVAPAPVVTVSSVPAAAVS